MKHLYTFVLLSSLMYGNALTADHHGVWKAPRGPGGINPDLNGVWQLSLIHISEPTRPY